MNWKKHIPTVMTKLGFGKLSLERQQTLGIILLGTFGLHLAVLIIFGSVVMIRSVLEEKTVFVAPPPIKTYEPRKLEHKVKVSKRQRSSSRPSVVPRMVATKLSQFALPEIKVDPKVVKTSFQPKFKAVTGVGLGAGLGTGYGLGGFGQGVSAFDFFGIRGRGDKIAILVDVSVSMVEDVRGGFDGFDRVRQRIGKVIDAFSQQSLFNIVIFADAGQTFKTEMLPATETNKRDAKAFLAKYNTKSNYGLTSGNVQGSRMGLQANGGTTRLDLALTAAFEQGADTILIISDGLPRVSKQLTSEQSQAWNNKMQQWHDANRGALEAYGKAAAAATYVTKRVWVPPSSGGGGIKEGGGGGGARPGHWAEHRVPTTPLPHRPTPPGMPDSMQWWTLEDFVEHFRILNEASYVKKGKKAPIVHCIGYAIDKDGGDFLQAFTKQYNGSYRRVGKIN